MRCIDSGKALRPRESVWMGIRSIIIDLLELYELIVVLYVVMSWFPPSPTAGVSNRFRLLLDQLTAPVLNPLRRLLPQVGGVMRFDFSPLIVILLIQLILIPIIAR
jgi:YggT family protein